MTDFKKKARNKSHKHEAVSNMTKIIGQNLKSLRLSYSVTQKEISKILHVTYQQVQKYESGKNRLSAEDLFILKEYFGVSFDVFYDGIKTSQSTKTTELVDKISKIKDPDIKQKISKIIDIL